MGNTVLTVCLGVGVGVLLLLVVVVVCAWRVQIGALRKELVKARTEGDETKRAYLEKIARMSERAVHTRLRSASTPPLHPQPQHRLASSQSRSTLSLSMPPIAPKMTPPDVTEQTTDAVDVATSQTQTTEVSVVVDPVAVPKEEEEEDDEETDLNVVHSDNEVSTEHIDVEVETTPVKPQNPLSALQQHRPVEAALPCLPMQTMQREATQSTPSAPRAFFVVRVYYTQGGTFYQSNYRRNYSYSEGAGSPGVLRGAEDASVCVRFDPHRPFGTLFNHAKLRHLQDDVMCGDYAVHLVLPSGRVAVDDLAKSPCDYGITEQDTHVEFRDGREHYVDVVRIDKTSPRFSSSIPSPPTERRERSVDDQTDLALSPEHFGVSFNIETRCDDVEKALFDETRLGVRSKQQTHTRRCIATPEDRWETSVLTPSLSAASAPMPFAELPSVSLGQAMPSYIKSPVTSVSYIKSPTSLVTEDEVVSVAERPERPRTYLPFCQQDMQCLQINDAEHYMAHRHTCRIPACGQAGDPNHSIFFKYVFCFREKKL